MVSVSDDYLWANRWLRIRTHVAYILLILVVQPVGIDTIVVGNSYIPTNGSLQMVNPFVVCC